MQKRLNTYFYEAHKYIELITEAEEALLGKTL